MERRFAVHAGPHRQALTALVAIVLATAPAVAAPKGRAAKAQFDKGVAAYGKSDYVTASLAFGKSYALEADVETLFAWAQSERKQGDCAKASELYAKLLASKLPAENKSVVQGQLDECKRILDDEQAKAAAAERARVEQNTPPTPPAASPADAPPVASPSVPPDVASHAAPPEPATSPWYKDPAGDVLTGLGIVGVGLGGVMLMSASSASSDSKSAPTYDQFKTLDDKAKSRGTIGVIAGGVGAALIIGGVIRYATRSSSSESTTVTGWVDAHASGVAVAGTW